MKCPICSSDDLEIREKVVEIPYFGKVLLFSIICKNCGFRKSDIEILEDKGEKKIEFEVKSAKDLNVLVVRSATASIYIPEFEVELEPGLASQAFITTVEGILYRIKDIVETALKWKINDLIEKTTNCFDRLLEHVNEAEAREIYKLLSLDEDIQKIIEKYGIKDEKLIAELKKEMYEKGKGEIMSIRKAVDILRRIQLAQDGKYEFRIIIEDPRGNSAILSKEAKIERKS